MTTIVELLLRPQTWPTTAWIALAASVATFTYRFLRRPPLPRSAPMLWKEGDWPLIGAVRFYIDKHDMFQQAQKTVTTGNFSFYIGKKLVVSLSGSEGRKAFFECKDLHLNKGNLALFPAQPVSPGDAMDLVRWFNKTLINMMRTEVIDDKLKILAGEVRQMWEGLSLKTHDTPDWIVINPFIDVYRLVYTLTTRFLGANEIVEDPELFELSLSLFEKFDQFNSGVNSAFPWLPTPEYILRFYYGIRLFWVFWYNIKRRQWTGKRQDDVVQHLLDTGSNSQLVASFQIAAVFTGQVNSGVMTSWLPVYWAMQPVWKVKVREEVDAAVAKHRASSTQSSADILDSLTLKDWENEFPLLDLSLRESIRLGLTGVDYRMNDKDFDIAVGNSGECVPRGAYAVYLHGNSHRDPSIYKDPETFDPSRYFDDRAEDRKQPHGYIGWGSGRHPCLGMRTAKLESTLVSAYLLALCDFELSDKEGKELTEAPPRVNINQNHVARPEQPVYLRLRARKV